MTVNMQEFELIDSDSLSESENLASPSLSEYDCDSEGEASGSEVDDEESDGEVGMRSKPKVMNLQFQLNAARAGKQLVSI